MKRILILFVLTSTICFAGQDSCTPCELFSHQEIARSHIDKVNPLLFLALTCHEFSNDQIKKKLDAILKEDPEILARQALTFNGVTFWYNNKYVNGFYGKICSKYDVPKENMTNFQRAREIIEDKLAKGCTSKACESFISLLDEAQKKRAREEENIKTAQELAWQLARSEKEKTLEAEYQNAINEFKKN